MSFRNFLGSVFSLSKLTNKQIAKTALWDSRTTFTDTTQILRFAKLTNVQVGRYSRIGVNCKLKDVTIGNFTCIAYDSVVGTGIHPTNMLTPHSIFYKKGSWGGRDEWLSSHEWQRERQITIGNDVLIGCHSIIMDGVKIGDGAIIGAGSVVAKDVPPYAIVGGAGPRIIRYRFSQDIIDYLEEIRWWDLPDNQITRCIGAFHKENPTLDELKYYFDGIR